MEITKETIIGDVLDAYPDTAPLFLEIGMHCLGCPASRANQLLMPAQFMEQTLMSLLKSLMHR